MYIIHIRTTSGTRFMYKQSLGGKTLGIKGTCSINVHEQVWYSVPITIKLVAASWHQRRGRWPVAVVPLLLIYKQVRQVWHLTLYCKKTKQTVIRGSLVSHMCTSQVCYYIFKNVKMAKKSLFLISYEMHFLLTAACLPGGRLLDTKSSQQRARLM